MDRAKGSQGHGEFAIEVMGHDAFNPVVTVLFARSQIVTPVVALTIASIGVTTP